MSRLLARAVAPALLLLFVAACSSGGPGRRPAPVDHSQISAEELQAAGFLSAFEVVQSRRPQWLRLRGRTSINQNETIKVYLDGSLLGGPEQLRQITTRSISSIRFMDGNQATSRWGLDHGQGAIVVSTRKESRP